LVQLESRRRRLDDLKTSPQKVADVRFAGQRVRRAEAEWPQHHSGEGKEAVGAPQDQRALHYHRKRKPLISGQTHGVVPPDLSEDTIQGTMIGDPQPTGDMCDTRETAKFVTGKNIGDLLNAKGINWGYFQGGFDLSITNPDGSKGCNRSQLRP
jgi:hypothetical protein